MYISLFTGFIENFLNKIIGYLHFSFINNQFVYICLFYFIYKNSLYIKILNLISSMYVGNIS